MPDASWNYLVMDRLSEQFRLILKLRAYMEWEQIFKMERLHICTNLHPTADTAIVKSQSCCRFGSCSLSGYAALVRFFVG